MSEQVDAVVESPVKRMRLRNAGTCVRCGTALEAKSWAFYGRISKTVHCMERPERAARGDRGTGPSPTQRLGGRTR